MIRRSSLTLTAATCAAFLTAGCSATGKVEGAAQQQAQGGAGAQGSGGPGGGGGAGRGGGGPVPVTVGRVMSKSMPLDLRVIGTVEPSSTVAVRAQLTGELTS